MSMEDNKASIRRAIEAWNRQDWGYLTLYDPSVVHHGLAPEPLDFAGQKATYEAMWEAFPNSQIRIDDLIAEGDKLSCRFTLSAQHEGEFMGVPATGKSITLSGQTIFRFAGGRVVERWTNTDTMGLMVQLGAIPAPA